jgi:hypothetical protein
MEAVIYVDGLEDVIDKFETMSSETVNIVDDQLQKWCQIILTEARLEVPIKTGLLLRSGHIEDAGGLAYDIVFDREYAEVQHENEQFDHKFGRKAKYLEDPVNRTTPMIARGIERYLAAFYSTLRPSMTGMSSSTRKSLGNLGGRFI